MNFDLPSDKGIGGYPAGMARLLKPSTIFNIRIVEYQGPIELCLSPIALPNDVILAFRSRAIALITLFEDAIVSKPDGIGKYLSTIPVDGQLPVGFADNNRRRMMRARPLDGLLDNPAPRLDPTFIGIMP